MEKGKLLAGFVFIFLVQSPLVLAITCNLVSPANYNQCMDILNSGIAENESELLISNLEYSNKFFPDHDYIFNKNFNLDIIDAPVGVKVYDKEFIKSAWASIFALMPSVIYNNVLYVPEDTTLLTGYNSNIK